MARTGRQTPTKSVELPYIKTKGEQAIKLYSLTGRQLMPWQKDRLRFMMGRNEQNLWVHTKYGYSVPRRNGKTEDVYAREMWGLVFGEHILHTAHRTDTAHSSFEMLYKLLSDAGIPIAHIYRANGKEHITVDGGGTIEYRTRTSSGGLGQGYDLLVIDEAQEYTSAQETALNYIVTASKNPQTIMLGTPPTAVSSGTVFQGYRKKVLSGNVEDSGWAEWSVEQMSDPHDVDLWYEANPSLGILLKERDVKSELSGDETDFNIQRLGLWIEYSQKSEISAAEWKELRIDKLPKLKGKLFAGIKYGKDATNVSLSIAVRTEDGKIFIESIDCRPMRSGNLWLINFLQSADVEAIIIDGASGQQALESDLKDAKVRPKPILPKVAEIITANAMFLQAVESKEICHMGQASLTQVVTNSEKRAIGSRGGFGFSAQVAGMDVSLMDSAILAYWGCATMKKKGTQQVSY